jgi:hypothetical protein
VVQYLLQEFTTSYLLIKKKILSLKRKQHSL